MNRFDLFRSIGEVDEKLLARSEVRYRRRPGRRVWFAAASFALCIGILGLALMLTGTPGHSSGAPTTPRFFISAYAEDGSLINLSQDDRCNNGLPIDKTRFDTDYPMFCFYLNNGNWDKERQLGENVEIVASYNGNVVWMGGARDPHLQLYYKATDNPLLSDLYLEKVVGWFEEPTDIVFEVQKTLWGSNGRPEKTITLETFTVNVCYIAQTNNYRLTVTNVQEGESIAEKSTFLWSESLEIARISNDDIHPLTPEQLAAPTDELVGYLLEEHSNWIYSFMICSTPEMCDAIWERCEGLKELAKRPDAASVLLSRFARMLVFEENVSNLEEYGLLALLNDPFYCDQLTGIESEVYTVCRQIYYKRYYASDEKSESASKS